MYGMTELYEKVDAFLECDRCGDVDYSKIHHTREIMLDKRIVASCRKCGHGDCMVIRDIDIGAHTPVHVMDRLHGLASRHSKVLEIITPMEEGREMTYYMKRYEVTRERLSIILDMTRAWSEVHDSSDPSSSGRILVSV